MDLWVLEDVAQVLELYIDGNGVVERFDGPVGLDV